MASTDRATEHPRPALSIARPASGRRATVRGAGELPPAPTDAEVAAMARKLGAPIRQPVDAE